MFNRISVFAKRIVSQNKLRFQQGDFDLDLSYITDRVIAMSFPTCEQGEAKRLLPNIEGIWRNQMSEVVRFLETYHPAKYKVFNLCEERSYPIEKLRSQVVRCPFKDHNAPPLSMICQLCEQATAWLNADVENVVVIHCKAGKSRTGLMICSLLMYMGIFSSADTVMEYYGDKRTNDGKGVTLPSQRRYVKYFEIILTTLPERPIMLPPAPALVLQRVRLRGAPHWFRPALRVLSHKDHLFVQQYEWQMVDSETLALECTRGLCNVCGDFKILFKDGGGKFFAWLHTGMLPDMKSGEIKLSMRGEEMDYFLKRWRHLPSDFQIELVLQPNDSKPIESPPGTNSTAWLKTCTSDHSAWENIEQDGGEDKYLRPTVHSVGREGVESWATSQRLSSRIKAVGEQSGEELQSLRD